MTQTIKKKDEQNKYLRPIWNKNYETVNITCNCVKMIPIFHIINFMRATSIVCRSQSETEQQ